MKTIQKASMKKKIISALFSLVAFCAVIVIIIVSRNTSVSAAKDDVIIGGKTYSTKNPMVILEIVPDKSFDILEPLVRRVDTSSANVEDLITWQDLINGCPKGEAKKTEISNYADKFKKYLQYIDTNISGSKIGAYFKIGGKLYGYNDQTSDWIDTFGYDVTKEDQFKIVYYELDDSGNRKAEIEGVNDIFSYIVFGNSKKMEGKVEVRVKTANNVTKQDIDDAGLVYFSKNKNGYTSDFYPSASVTDWGASCDLKADVAMHLIVKKSKEAKAILYASTDKSMSTNIGKALIITSGLESPYFVKDFLHYKVSDTEYYGNCGGIYIDNSNNIRVYLHWNESDKTDYTYSGKKDDLPIKSDMYIAGNIEYASWGVNVYGPSSNGRPYPNKHGNGESYYPVYNATTQDRQDILTRDSFEFNGGSQMSHGFTSDILVQDDYYSNGKYKGTFYDDAKKVYGKDKLGTFDAIRYILGDYDTGEVKSIRVLEIEPAGYYRFTSDNDKYVVAGWLNLSADDVEVTIDHCSMNAFNGLNKDLSSEYDLIVFGAYTSGGLNTSVFGKVYNTGTEISTGVSGTKLNGNDMTDKMYNNLKEYIYRGLPIVIDDEIYDDIKSVIGDSSKSAEKNNVNSYFTMEKLTEMLRADKKSFSNISSADFDIATTTSKDGSKTVVNPIPLTYSIRYVQKPRNEITCTLADYKKTKSVVKKSSLKNGLTFSGYLDAGEYKIKIYVDRNRDSIFSEDVSTEDAELIYGGVDGIAFTQASAGTYTVSDIKIPTGMNGYVAWRVRIENTKTGQVKNSDGAFAIEGDGKTTIKVLQIVATDGDTELSNLDLSDGSDFMKAYNNIKGITGLNISIDKKTKSQLNDLGSRDNILAELNNYSMLVLGLADDYGNKGDLSDNAVNAIKDYIDAGNSVLFTHDALSYKKNSGTSKVAVEKYDELSYSTKIFKSEIGMKTGLSLSDSLMYKMNYDNNSKSPSMSYMKYDSEQNKMTLIKTNVKYKDSNGKDKHTPTRTTNKVQKLNDGQITSYPYDVSGAEISVACTHGQYFALNLEEGATKPNGSAGDEVVVWYTLGETSSTDDKGYAMSDYFSCTGQDAISNYYAYSYGNVTYTSAGHSKVTGESSDEMKVFVNTFVRALLAGNMPPQVEYPNTSMENDHLFSKSFYLQLISSSEFYIDYIISDPDLIDGTGRISSAFVYYDANSNDKYDSDSSSGDKLLGYLDEDGNIVSYKPAQSVLSGKQYKFNLYAVSDLNMKDKLLKGELKIGIQAVDSRNNVGYAEIIHYNRDLIPLD